MDGFEGCIQWAGENATWLLDKTGTLLLPQLRRIQGWWKPQQTQLDFGRAIIAGAGGVGKSTLGRVITGDFLTPEQWEYTESLDVENVKSASSNVPNLTILPGQEHRRSVMWELPLRTIENDECKGLILVTCNGYNSLGKINVGSHRLWDGSLRKFRAAYIAENQASDLDIVDRVIPFLERRRTKFWVLHVINKADLWWQNADQVRRHAASGDIQQKIKGALRHGNRYESCILSLSIKNVNTIDGTSLFTHHNSFDTQQQMATQKELFDKIESLQAWSDSDA